MEAATTAVAITIAAATITADAVAAAVVDAAEVAMAAAVAAVVIHGWVDAADIHTSEAAAGAVAIHAWAAGATEALVASATVVSGEQGEEDFPLFLRDCH